MKRWKKRVLWAFALNAILIAAWFVWGEYQTSRFEDRLAAMRADGRVSTIEDLSGPPIPDEDNGWALLSEAADAYRDVRMAFDDRHPDTDSEDLPWGGEDEPLTPAQRTAGLLLIEDATACLEKLDEALRYPVIAKLEESPLESSAAVQLIGVMQLWHLVAQVQPERMPDMVDRMMHLLGKWRVRCGADVALRAVLVRTLMLNLLRSGIEDGSIDGTHATRWRGTLVAEESRLIELMPLSDRNEIAVALWVVNGWRNGEDPMASVRKNFQFLADITADIGADLEGAEGEEIDDVNEMVTQFTSIAEPPWYTAWYGQPLLHYRANELLDAFEADAPRPWSLERLRADVTNLASHETGSQRMLLQTIASMRLGRIALGLTGRQGEPEERVAMVERELGGPLPVDPFSGVMFSIEHGDVFELRCAASKALLMMDAAYTSQDDRMPHDQLHEDTLLWRVP